MTIGQGLRIYSPMLIIGGIITIICLRSMLFTCMFFHTHLENLVGYLIATLALGFPLTFFSSTPYWWNCVFGVSLSSEEDKFT
jgi:Mn2+/Fe2+ NRAMP family transporter